MARISQSMKILAHAAFGEKVLEYGIGASLIFGLAGIGFAMRLGL